MKRIRVRRYHSRAARDRAIFAARRRGEKVYAWPKPRRGKGTP